jgi:hypothetical protein
MKLHELSWMQVLKTQKTSTLDDATAEIFLG